ncbi:MAG: right-handed parallel beta-helix repeat-containing protein [Planctomycetota bacterium]
MPRCPLRAAVVLASVSLTAITHAGPLAPPAGAPAPTDTALRNTDPRTPINDATAPPSAFANHVISSPGTYYLTADIVADQNKTGIQIDAVGVTLDLNGFALIGLGPSTTVSLNGIAPADGTVIRNGQIRDFTSYAIEGNFDDDILIEHVTVRNCGRGIAASTNSRVINCAVYDTGDVGIRVSNSGLVEGCVSDGHALSGITAGAGSIVLNCTASNNGSDGIFANSHGLIKNCIATDNDSDGIQVFFGGSVIDCVSSGNKVGFLSGASTLFHRCHAYDSTIDGFDLGQGCVARECLSTTNGIRGFQLDRSTIVDSVSRSNGFSGINAVDDCLVRGCVCFDNNQSSGSGGGVHVEGSGNVVQNTVSRDNAGLGIQVHSASGNRVVGNWSYDNAGGQYSIPLGNAYGPYVSLGGGGNIAAQAFSEHPLANFQN